MSWDSYCDSVISVAGGDCDSVAIIGVEGSIWTSVDGSNNKTLVLSPAEAKKLAEGFDEGSSEFASNGVRINGIKYQFLRKDENVVHAKKKDQGCITMQKSAQAIVIGHTAEGKQAGNTNKGVGHVSDYLSSMGY